MHISFTSPLLLLRQTGISGLGILFPLMFYYIVPEYAQLYSKWERQEDFIASRTRNILFKERLTYDFIVVGGGSAGAVVANRLSEHFSVLLIERGGEQNPVTYIPTLAPIVLNIPALDYRYRTVPQKSSCLSLIQQQSAWPRGVGLGGSSNLNWMIYLRGHILDYENWANITGDQRWNYENVLPYFLKSEDYCVKCEKKFEDVSTFNPLYHNQKGLLTVEKASYRPLVEEFLQASEWSGIPRTDLNAPYQEGCSPIVLTTRNGRRCSTNTAFLDPIRNRRSLTIHKYARAYKILLRGDSNEAYGIEYEHHGTKKVAFSKLEVIISTGSIETPKLLMLSGIGPRNHLESIGIHVVLDAPGVGQNLQDHFGTVFGPFLINQRKSFIIEREITVRSINHYLQSGKGFYSSPAIHGISFHASSLAKRERLDTWPDIQTLFGGNGVFDTLNDMYTRSFNLRFDVAEEYLSPVIGRDGFVYPVYVLRPKSRGHILLRSANYKHDPIIDPKYFEDSEQNDIKIVIEGVKRLVNISENSPGFAQLGAHLSPIPFPSCKTLQFRSDAYWECFIRHFTQNEFHYVGTAAMGKRDSPNSVVDSELRVIGTERLRVIDASIMPEIVTANTNAPTIMIAERGADFITEYWMNRIYYKGLTL